MINQEISVVIDDQGNTVKCGSECLACTTGRFCEVCALGYSVSDIGKCVFCRQCLPDTPNNCISCFKPEVLNPTTKTCQKPKCNQIQCLFCDNNGAFQYCLKGYSIYEGSCVRCQQGCPSCTNSGGESCDIEVSSCKLGFAYFAHVSRKVNFSCAECANGCLSCSETDISNCTSCNEGFYSSLNSQTNILICLICMQNCQTCSTPNTCNQCLAGYRLNEKNSTCIEKCHSNCLTCSQLNKAGCRSCCVGSLLEESKCVADLSCNTDQNCTVCGDGYALQNGECLQCNYDDENCQGCEANDLDSCFKCKFGFLLTADRQCVPCDSSCSGCLNSDACFSCSQGFYLGKTYESVTGKCLACISQCKTCNQFTYLCTSCKTGFLLDGSKCISDIHVDYTLTINSPVQEMVSLGRTFLSVLVDFASKRSVDPLNSFSITSNDVTIRTLKSGSTVVSGSISTFTKAQSDLISNLVGIQLQKGYLIIYVQSNTVTPEDDNETLKISLQPELSSSQKLAILLGVLIPVLVIMIVAGIILAVRCLKKRGVSVSNPSSKEEYFVNDSSKTINRTSQQLQDKV